MTDSVPEVSNHASAMWAARSAIPTDLSPTTAWQQAVRIDEPHGLEADEVRYHPPADCVLLRKDSSVVTVIPVDGRSKPALKQAIQRTQVGAEVVAEGGESA